MPKKRNYLQHTKPNSPAHPSLSSSDKPTSHSLNSSSSDTNPVNQKLQELRLEKSHGTAPLVVKAFQSPLLHTASPSIRDVLQIPQTLPPRPRPGLRVSGGRRGPAGPPPPGSWLQKNTMVKKVQQEHSFKRGEKEIKPLPGSYLPSAGSLIDHALKAIATNWEWHTHYDQYYLAMIPVRYKEVLLHKIALHSQQGIDAKGLEVLFHDETELEDATGAAGLTHLDLSTSIGSSLALKDLKSILLLPKTSTSVEASPYEPTESWDASIPPEILLMLPKFHTLTHLSLAYPAPAASWNSLLNLAPNLKSLTHLSLAYWPTPTLAPNSSTAYTATPSGHVQYGASNYYSHFDDDFTEAAGIFRRLCKQTICLQWLDLTGCYPWTKCLTYKHIDWSGAWAGLETVEIGQSYYPGLIDEPNRFSNETPKNSPPKEAYKEWAVRQSQIEKLAFAIRRRVEASEREAALAREKSVGGGDDISSDDSWTASRAKSFARPGVRTARLHVACNPVRAW